MHYYDSDPTNFWHPNLWIVLMAWLVSNSGTQTATGGEDTLATPATNGTFALWVDKSAMAAASTDAVIFRIYYQVDGTNYRLAYEATFNSDQMAAILSPFIPAVTGIKATLQQTAGTNRAYPWQILVN
jgi:hypothetical protein